ncbi:MAG: TetR/AcrR family transcriptional regulator [Stackebrandtia sp.]
MTGIDGPAPRLPRNQRRRQLLDAAQEVFVANGYHSTAMDDIAERAGVSKPVLYQHFPGKLELYLALLETHGDALVDTVRTAMESTKDNKTRVHRAMQAYFDFVDARGEAFRLVFESDLRHEPVVAERIDRVERDCGLIVAETIMGDTGVGRERAELLAFGLTGAAEMAARRWLASKRAVPKADAVQLLATLTWRGISRFPLQNEGDADGPED